MQIVNDNGYVIYNIDTNTYFCGLNQWDKQLRKAKIYHSDKYINDAIKDQTSKIKGRLIKLLVEIKIIM